MPSETAPARRAPTAEPVAIRRAVMGDFEPVTQLLVELGRAAPTPETRGAVRGTWERHISHPECRSLVAVGEGGRIVGFCALEFRDRLNSPYPEAWIPDLVVTESERGRDVGHDLIEAVIRETIDRRAQRIVVELSLHHARAQSLFRDAGFRDLGTVFAWDPPPGTSNLGIPPR